MSATARISQNSMQQRPSSLQEAHEQGQQRGQVASMAEAVAVKTAIGGMNFFSDIVAGAAGFAAGMAVGEVESQPTQVKEPTIDEMMEMQAMKRHSENCQALEQQRSQGQDDLGL